MEDFKTIFIDDALKIVFRFRGDFALLKPGERNTQALDNIHRYAHSLKGLSGMMDFKAIYSISQDLESRLGTVINGSSGIERQELELIEDGFNKIEALLKNGR